MKALLPYLKITFKPILTLSILLIANLPTYSQQTSKILHTLQEELKNKNIYFEPLDSILKQHTGQIFLRYKNVTFPDFRKTAESQYHETVFDNLIKLAPDNFKLFGQYSVDTISYYFKKSKLVRCWYQLKLPVTGNNDAFDFLYTRLNDGFNSGKEAMETNIADYLGYRWVDDYIEVDLLAKIRIPSSQDNTTLNSKSNVAYVSIEMFKPNGINALLEKQTAQIKSDRSGKGNSTFSLSVSKLENIINLKTTLRGMEYQLGRWSSYGNLNEVGAEYDDKTKDFTIPLFQVHYEVLIKNKYYFFEADVNRTLTNPIKELRVIATLNGMELAEFKESLEHV